MAHLLQASEYTRCASGHEIDRKPQLESLPIPTLPSRGQSASSDHYRIRRSLRLQKLHSVPQGKRTDLVLEGGIDLPKSRERDGRILLHCHAGCSTEEVLAALMIDVRDLFEDANRGRRLIAEYDYCDEKGELLFQVVRFEPKDFRQRRPDGNGGWTWKLNDVRRVLYHLPDLISAHSVIVCEGEKDCETARAMGLIATCNPHGAGKWRSEYVESLRGKRVSVIADADEPGRKHARQMGASLYGKVESLKVMELPGAKDLTVWVERGGTRDALIDLIQNAPEWKPQTVDGAEVLTSVYEFVRRFVSLSEPQAAVVSLWVAHTHAIGNADATPYLAITSAEKQCGKTRLLEVVQTVVANPWPTGRVTAAVLVRKIDADKPTLLLDESDAAFGGEKEYSEALRGILNTGHKLGGVASNGSVFAT